MRRVSMASNGSGVPALSIPAPVEKPITDWRSLVLCETPYSGTSITCQWEPLKDDPKGGAWNCDMSGQYAMMRTYKTDSPGEMKQRGWNADRACLLIGADITPRLPKTMEHEATWESHDSMRGAAIETY